MQCRACPAFNALSIPLLLAAVLVPQLLALRAGALGEHDEGGVRGVTAAAAAVLGALIAARVLSPQYLLWLCPLLAVAGGWQGRVGLVIAAGLTSLVYPVLYTDLVDSETAGHGRALAAAVARNVLLVVLYAFLVRGRCARSRTRRPRLHPGRLPFRHESLTGPDVPNDPRAM